MGDGRLTKLHLEKLGEAPENPRTIRDDKLDLLIHSLRTDPSMLEARPLIADAETGTEDEPYEVIAGNMRLAALREIESDGDLEALLPDGIPVYLRTFDSPAERREWLLRDNAAYGEWVPSELAALIAAHEREGADLAMLGFSSSEADGLLALAAVGGAGAGGDGHGDPDDAGSAAPPEKPTTEPGDLYRLGEHYLLCADAAHPDSYARLLEHVPGWDLMWTDPPYGVGYDAEARESYFSPDRLARPLGEIEGDSKQSIEVYTEWLTEVLVAATGNLREGGSVYVCHADKMVEAVSTAFRAAGLFLSSQLIWLKTVLVFGRSDYHYKHEPLLYGWKEGAAHRWFGDRSQTTVIEVASDHYNENKGTAYVHPTQKPYELIKPGIENSSARGEIVLEPFGGSGSTLVACEALGRRCVCLELDPKYCDVIVARWEAFSGQAAEFVSAAPELVE